MNKHIIRYSRLAFLLCLLVALHTSCSADQHILGVHENNCRARSHSLPNRAKKEHEVAGHTTTAEDEKQNPKDALCSILLSRLAYRGSDRAGRDEDRYDRETFQSQMESLIKNDRTAQGAQYHYIQEKAPMLVVAIHYSTDTALVQYLLERDAHKGLSGEWIETCLITAAENHAEKAPKKAMLRLLLEAFKDSVYLQGGAGSLDRLLFACHPSGLLVLIGALTEKGINIHQADASGNTLLHRICKNPMHYSIGRIEGLLKELLILPEIQKCRQIKNNSEYLPKDTFLENEESYNIIWPSQEVVRQTVLSYL